MAETPPSAPLEDEPPRTEPWREARVPSGRTQRLLHLGRAVGEVAAGAAAEGIAQLARGQRPALSAAMFTPANAQRLAGRLSAMRGAAMKVGQLLSMDGQGVLPPAFAELLGRLRDGAHVMPSTQLVDALARAYGEGWHQRFRRFSFAPVASASIGQVHRAETHDGRVLALKIQHPGVRDSVDGDIANLALLTRVPGLWPAGLDPAAILERARVQLHRETDYEAEARAMRAYRQQIGDDPVLFVPEVDVEHSTQTILATTFADGEPVDRLLARAADAALRDQVATTLCRLALRELFGMQLVQTDPNFSNYLFDAASGRIALVDFGATEEVSATRVEQMRDFGRALRDGREAVIEPAARALELIGDTDTTAQRSGVLELLRSGSEPLRHRGAYDFAGSGLVGRLFDQGRDQWFGPGFARTPPADVVFLYRKFVGTFLLCARLRARVDLGRLFDEVLEPR